MDQHWHDVKTAYRKIMDNAFDTKPERNSAHDAFLRFSASFFDLAMSRDPAISAAKRAFLDPIPNDDDSVVSMDLGGNDEAGGNDESGGNEGNYGNGSEPVISMANIIQVLQDEARTLNPDQLRQMFPFWSVPFGATPTATSTEDPSPPSG